MYIHELYMTLLLAGLLPVEILGLRALVDEGARFIGPGALPECRSLAGGWNKRSLR